ncbi:hypothetical protein EDC01DRAFT_526089 [Geopyxis carbonaria]|nr:hypothetical protein EDC01DRAFT_526089 [Geopyxis carbonaria]
MQIAIRRVFPIARQRIACPHRFASTTSTHLRIRAHSRCFSQTARALQIVDDSIQPSGSSGKPAKKGDSENAVEGTKEEGGVVIETQTPSGGEQEILSTEEPTEVVTNALPGANGGEGTDDRPPRRGRPVGAKARRAPAAKPVVEIPKPVIPQWFIDKSAYLREDNALSTKPQRLGLYSDPKSVEEPAVIDDLDVIVNECLEAKKAGKDDVEVEETKEAAEPVVERYRLHESVYEEIKTQIRTGMLLPKGSYTENLASIKSHCLLHMPKEGGVYFLDALTERLAVEAGADLVRIDAQDFAEIAGDYLGDSRHSTKSDISSFGIRSLGYDTQISPHRDSAAEEEESDETTDDVYEDEDVVVEGQEHSNSPNIMPLYALQQLLRSSHGSVGIMPVMQDSTSSAGLSKDASLDRINERKMNNILDAMVSSAEFKRILRQNALEVPAADPTAEPVKIPQPIGKTIIHIRDYREMERTTSGRAVLDMLHNLVQDRRKLGAPIVVVGTSSAEEDASRYSKSGVQYLQSHSPESFERKIVVPPMSGEAEDKIFVEDRDARIREINIRHLRDVVERRSGADAEAAWLDIPSDWHLTPELNSEYIIPGISEKVWTFDYVHRVLTAMLGARDKPPRRISLDDVEAAVKTIQSSDEVKFEWAQKQSKVMVDRPDAKTDEEKPKTVKIPKNLTTHEKKLVGGIIDPASIHGGFSSVRAPPETIETMKVLTSLSLIRPEAFKYGVLATDRIPGVLLYGPPGTGKTLIAKAVAKESGASVLEVSGADISDMFIGESEKNVKAIFSLAKKLSPCVVFIDEADAIFGSRQSPGQRSSHRETINQFLKEWADMTSTAFIMIATNRPFDLDDAVLRRLPRRVLVDLPTPADRLAILQIHLKDEQLDGSVDLEALAKRTSLYSGSDLKNICVSAALSCVREEHAAFEAGTAFPAKRVLRASHFETAMGEISASISDDMGSLSLIRKFDERYGERASGRKKKSAWGFEQGQTEAHHKGEGRVRMD